MELETKTQLPRPGRSNLCVRVYRPVPYAVSGSSMDHMAPMFLFEPETTTAQVLPGVRAQSVKTQGTSMGHSVPLFRFEPESTTATRLLRVRFHDGPLQSGKQVSLSVELGFVSTN